MVMVITLIKFFLLNENRNFALLQVSYYTQNHIHKKLTKLRHKKDPVNPLMTSWLISFTYRGHTVKAPPAPKPTRARARMKPGGVAHNRGMLQPIWNIEKNCA